MRRCPSNTFVKVTLQTVLILVAFVLPAAVFSDTPPPVDQFPDPFPTIKSVGLQASIQIGGVSVKLPVTVAGGSAFTVVWKSSGTGCVANWSGAVPLPPTGSATGSIITSRPFVITCFGRGAGQSKSMQVNVGVTDLAVPTFTIAGLKRARTGGTYLEGPYTLKATIKNLGKLPNATAFKVKYKVAKSADMTVSPLTIGEITVNGITSSQSKVLEAFPWASTPSADPSYFQICADAEAKITEPSETNNCSKVLGPYKFSAKP